MKQEHLDKLKALNSLSRSAGTFWDRYQEAISISSCDKHVAAFNDDDRFVVFRVMAPLFFSAYTGRYGNKACSTFDRFDSDLASRYFVLAVNSMARELFAKMADLAAQDAAELSGAARREMAEIQDEISRAEQAA